MKLIFLILFLPSLLLPSDFSKFSSVNFDLVGVVASGDKIAAYGTKGSVYYSDNDAQSWNVIKPFETGNIVNFFIENDRLIAFLQTGEVSQSFDNGQNWNVTNPINDSVSYVVKGNDGYYIRAQNSIFKLSENLTLSNSYLYPYYMGFDITYHYSPRNRMSMSFLDNKLFVINIYANGFMVFDNNLNKIDSVDIGEKLLDSKIFISNLINNSEDLIVRLGNYKVDSTFIYKLDPNLTELEVLLNLSESREQQGKKFKENSPIVYNFNLYKDKLYTFNPFSVEFLLKPYYNVFELISKDSAEYKGVIDATVVIPTEVLESFTIADFVIENDRITGISKNNLIVTKKINSGSTDRVSNLVGSGSSSNLFQINDSGYLLFATRNIYMSNDTTKTFKKVIGDSAIYSDLSLGVKFYHFNQKQDKLLFFKFAKYNNDSSLVYISDDYGNKFSKKLLEGVDFKANYKYYRILKDDDDYIVSETSSGSPTSYITYDKDFNYLSTKVDSNYRYDYLFGEDLTNFTFLGASIDLQDKNRYLKSTTDGGENWNDLRTFSFTIDTIWYNDSTQYFTSANSDLRYNKSVDYDGKPYVFLVTYNTSDSLYKMEAMNLQTNEFSLVYQNKQDTYSNILIEFIDREYFICKGDTLFTTSNILDYNSWQGQKLPNNGAMLNRIMKSGDYLITYYYDDIHPYDIYRIKWNELSITSITENETEIIPYFYNSLPYPQPTNSLVSTKVYLDNAISLSKGSIKIYDVNGTQVEKGENVEISGNNWPTTLTWDSNSQLPGVYFIVINYGENTKAIKVMKE